VHAYFSVSEADFMVFRAKNEGNTLAEKISKLPPLSLIMPDNSEYAQKGKVDMVNGQFDRTTGAITLRASFPNEKGLLRSGNTGKVRLGFPHENALLVPQSATVELQDKVFVYVVSADNKVTKTQIGIAGKSDNEYLVTTGVKAGDRIVYKGFESLQDGTVIAPEKINPELAAK
jgi:membrane fusion protein (multidrug efflux system)